MAFVITDVEVVVMFGVALIIVYFAGSYWKHRRLTWHAHWFEERFKTIAHVQFRSYGHAGLKVRCEMKEGTTAYRELHFTISLGARENLMYYALAELMDNRDRVNCWGVVDKPIKSNMVVARAKDRSKVAETEARANMNKMNPAELERLGFVVYASNREYASRFLAQAALASNLGSFGEVELVELDMLSSMIRIVSLLKTERLGELTDFVLMMGKAA